MLRQTVARTVWLLQQWPRVAPKPEKGGIVALCDIASKLRPVWGIGATKGGEFCHLFHTSSPSHKEDDRKEMLRSMPKRDEGTEGEIAVDIDAGVREFGGMFPDENTPNLLFGGVRFAELPIVHVKITKNNTIMALTNSQGKTQLRRSCGMEGFKNARKSTSVAAQATGISLAMKAAEAGYKDVRVKVKGLGAGRMSGLKGLTMGGLNVVSISDVTFINWNNNPRPKKARRL